ncbi:hypothetical protein J7E62_31890 [Variovorax paradoxus]|nr:hypothetical protein [Variovorax paradoxus]
MNARHEIFDAGQAPPIRWESRSAASFPSIKRRRRPTAKAMPMPSIACMSRFRFLVLMIEALRSGAFEWVLFESFDDVSGFEPFARSELSFTTYKSAWEAGCLALQSRMEEPKLDLLDDEA